MRQQIGKVKVFSSLETGLSPNPRGAVFLRVRRAAARLTRKNRESRATVAARHRSADGSVNSHEAEMFTPREGKVPRRRRGHQESENLARRGSRRRLQGVTVHCYA